MKKLLTVFVATSIVISNLLSQPVSILFNGDSLWVHPGDNSSSAPWAPTNDEILNLSGAKSPTNGNLNTKAIVDMHMEGNYAAYICDTLQAWGFDDWYLPARDELIEMYNNKALIGDLQDQSYWSSTERFDNPMYASKVFFLDGTVDSGYAKTTSYRVRCVRKESLKVEALFKDTTIGPCNSIMLESQVTKGTAMNIEWNEDGMYVGSGNNYLVTGLMPESTYEYSVFATDMEGNTSRDTVYVNTTSAISMIMPYDTALGECKSNFELAALVNGGSLPYSFNWQLTTGSSPVNNPNDSVASINLYSGYSSYALTVTDANGCSIVDYVNVDVKNLPYANAGTNQSIGSCAGSCAMLDPSMSSGDFPTYLWTPGNLTEMYPTVSPSTTTTFHLIVTDQYGCTGTDSVIISVENLNVEIYNPDTLIGLNQSIEISGHVTEGNSPFYEWSENGNYLIGDSIYYTPSFTFDTTLHYVLKATDIYGCSDYDTLTVIAQNDFRISDTTIKNLTCNSSADGEIQLQVVGGTMPYYYTWSNSATTQNLIGLSAGTYSVTIQDNNLSTIYQSFEVTEPPQLIVNTSSSSNDVCSGESVSIVSSASGGVLPYNYSWTSGSGSIDNSISQNITYTPYMSGDVYLTVTDANNCMAFDNQIINYYNLPNITILESSLDICDGDSVSLFAIGAISYEWSTTETDTAIYVKTAGTYSVTGTDMNGCISSATSQTISVTPAPFASAGDDVILWEGQSYPVNAVGASNYSSLNWTTSGDGSFDNSSTLFTTYNPGPNDVLTGSVSLTLNVMGNGSCPTEFDQMEITIYNSIPYTIFNGDTLWVNPFISTITPKWTESQFDINLGNGANSDSNGFANTQAIVHQTNQAAAVICDTCTDFGFTDWYLPSIEELNQMYNDTAQIRGFFDSYYWSSTETDANTAKAKYFPLGGVNSSTKLTTAKVRCVRKDVHDSLIIKLDSILPESNIGTNDGKIYLSVEGGSGFFSYSWDNSASTQDLTSLASGIYRLTVTDTILSLNSTASYTINPGLNIFHFASDSVYDAKCNGYSNGKIKVTLSGGAKPYSADASWTQIDDSTFVKDFLSKGNYLGAFFDNNADSIGKNFTINEPTPININLVNNYAISCNGFNDGAIFISVSGGTVTSEYEFLWSNSDTTRDISNLSPGSYSVLVSDNAGCTEMTSYAVTEPAPLSGTLMSKDVSCYGYSDGMIYVDGESGGSGTYEFSFDSMTSWSALDTLFNAVADTYYVYMRDYNNPGCELELSSNTVISEPTNIVITGTPTNPSSGLIKDGSINISVTGGTNSGYTFIWTGPDVIDTNQNQINLGAGTYDVIAYDSNGCSGSRTFQITEPNGLLVKDTLIVNSSCYNGTNGSIQITVSGGSKPYTLPSEWDMLNDSTFLLDSIPAGLYSLSISDGVSSTLNESYYVNQPAKIGITGTVTIPTCYNYSNGSITVSAINGLAPYTYKWNNGANSVINNNIKAGNYLLTVSDANNCKVDTIFTLSQGTLVKSGFTVTVDTLAKTAAFSNTSVNADLISWDFGDGTMSQDLNPSKTYSNEGEFLVCQTAKNVALVCISDTCAQVEIIQNIPDADAVFEIAIFDTINNIFSFTNNSTNYIGSLWTFGDGNYSQAINPIHQYKNTGTYNVCLTVYSTSGETAKTCKSITINEKECNVNADFNFFIDTLNKSIELNNLSTGNFNTVYWDFNDGNSSSKLNPLHVFQNSGVYLITLSVLDTINGCSDFAGKFVNVGEIGCKASFDFMIEDINNGKVKFNNYSSGNFSMSSWDFGNGDMSNEFSPQYTYVKGGKKYVTLTIMDSLKLCSDSKSKIVELGAIKCNADFKYFIDSANMKIITDNASIGDSLSYNWVFGDGTYNFTKNPTHIFKSPGYHNVSLTVFDKSTGCIDKVSKQIMIASQDKDCEADFMVLYDESLSKVTLVSTSMGNVDTYIWNFGDGSNPIITNEEVTNHNYNSPGEKTVCLTASGNGMSDMTCKRIYIPDNVNGNIKADFDFMFNTVSGTVNFFNNSDGNFDKLIWRFTENDSVVNIDNPSFKFDSSDVYITELEIRNTSTGQIDFAYELINLTMVDSLIGRYVYKSRDKVLKVSGYPVDFIGMSHGDASRMRWDFGDGESDTTTSAPTHYYAEAGNYYVCVEVEDPMIPGAFDTYCDSVKVGEVNDGIETLSDISEINLNLSPNPMKEYTKIDWFIPYSGQVNISLVSIKGEKIETIINTNKPAGKGSVLYRNNEISDGTYLIVMSFNNRKIVKILVKE